jgi:N-acetylmuramoyl-L-alanine amidase
MIPKLIIMHHSLTKDSGTVSWEAIRKYHQEVKGWSNIGYHFGIELVGDKYVVFTGRSPASMGAHCLGYNNRSLGICLVGNFNETTPPPEQWETAMALCAKLCTVYGIEQILGHREADKSRTCPGSLFDMDKFRIDVKNLKAE